MAGDGFSEDVACAGVDLEVEEGRVEKDVGGVVEGEGCGAEDLEFFGEEVVTGRETSGVLSAEGLVIGVPCCV